MNALVRALAQNPLLGSATIITTLLVLYLALINRRMRSVPEDVLKLKQATWTEKMLKETYARLEKNPVNVETTKDGLPPKLDRRYIITGGCGKSSQQLHGIMEWTLDMI